MKKIKHQNKIGEFYKSSYTGNTYQLINVYGDVGLLNTKTGILFSITPVKNINKISKKEFSKISCDVLNYIGVYDK